MSFEDDLAAIPQIERGLAWCTVCNHVEHIPTSKFRDGWPQHCGYTMTVGSPEERGAIGVVRGYVVEHIHADPDEEFISTFYSITKQDDGYAVNLFQGGSIVRVYKDSWPDIDRAVRALLGLELSVVPDGWKLLPITPDHDMSAPFVEATDDRGDFLKKYAEMLEAAPEPPKE